MFNHDCIAKSGEFISALPAVVYDRAGVGVQRRTTECGHNPVFVPSRATRLLTNADARPAWTNGVNTQRWSM